MTHTPTPWAWLIHDHSTASLGVMPDPGLGDPLVMSVSPCRACIDRAEPQEWKWGRCTTPSEDDAAFIVKAVNSHDRLVEALRQARAVMIGEASVAARAGQLARLEHAADMISSALEGL